jgi:hypothetical protein
MNMEPADKGKLFAMHRRDRIVWQGVCEDEASGAGRAV